MLSRLLRCADLGATLALVAAGLAFGAVVLAPATWPLPLLTPFVPQIASVAVVAWLAMACTRLAAGRRLGAARWLSLALPGLSAAVVLGGVFGLRVPALAWVEGPPRHELSVLSCNVDGRNGDPAAVARVIEAAGADVVLLTEIDTKCTTALAAALARYPFHRETTDDHGDTGIGVWSRHEIVAGGVVAVSPPQIDVVLRVAGDGGMDVRFLGVHPHAPVSRAFREARDATLRLVAERASSARGRPLLVAGDFNASPYCSCARELARALELADATAGVLRSWPTAKKLLPFATRLDHVWASAHFRSVAAASGPFVGSDHLPVRARLAW